MLAEINEKRDRKVGTVYQFARELNAEGVGWQPTFAVVLKRPHIKMVREM